MYTHNKDKIAVTCPRHGDFLIRAVNHKQGAGCKKCSDERNTEVHSKPEAEFIAKAVAVHGATYLYDDLKYINLEHKVNIKCRIHGGFLTNGYGHLKGKGCPLCADIRVGQTLENFLERSTEEHGDTYDYSKVEYIRSQGKVEIVCKVHNKSFWQTPSSHYAGKGCPDCGVRGYKTTKHGCLYVLFDAEAGVTKVGITNNKVTKRLSQLNCAGNKFKVVAEFWFDDGSVALNLETKFLRRLRGSFSQPTEKFGGSTECFYGVDVNKLLSEIQLSEVPDEHCNDPQ